ncbi:MAG TPA: STAS domain-containing protein [Candidatus Tectomicrobia bacterium]|nr:STAS domain-containing protein [Candidatus Tectomicrobia bacterium]
MIALDAARATVAPRDPSRAAAGSTTIAVAGAVTVATAWKVVAQVAAALEQGHTRLVLDLEGVTALDAAGVAALLEAGRLAERRPGGVLELRANHLVTAALTESGTTALIPAIAPGT